MATESRGDRADARRNRARVLAAAGEAFAEYGLDIPLGEVARRAGVGAGTVYRHFPTKQALLEAVHAQHLTDLIAVGDRLAAQLPPVEAFFELLLDVVESSHRRGPVCEIVSAEPSWPRPVLRALTLRFEQILTAMLHAAQRAGGVRADVDTDDVAALAVGCTTMLSARRDGPAGRRLVRLALDGLRPAAPVTERPLFRDAPTCVECAAPLTVRPTGRPSRYCGPTCRQRAHRRRLAG